MSGSKNSNTFTPRQGAHRDESAFNPVVRRTNTTESSGSSKSAPLKRKLDPTSPDPFGRLGKEQIQGEQLKAIQRKKLTPVSRKKVVTKPATEEEDKKPKST